MARMRTQGPDWAVAPEVQPSKNSAAIVIAALVLLIFCDPVWRLLLAQPTGDLPLTVTIIRACTCSIGVVVMASQWERAVGLVKRSPFLAVLVVLAPLSALWAASPAEALQHGLLLGMVVVAGIGMALRLAIDEIALALIVAGGCSGAAGLGVASSAGAFTADATTIGLLFSGGLILTVTPRAAQLAQGLAVSTWIGLAALIGSLGLAAGAFLAAGSFAGSALIAGAVLALSLHSLMAQGHVGPIGFMVIAASLIGSITGFAIFGGFQSLTAIGDTYAGLGSKLALGQGFGAAGAGYATAFGLGLGAAGTAILGLAVLGCLWSAFAGARGLVRRQLSDVMGAAGAVSACVALLMLMAFSAGSTPVIGALTMAWVATWAAAVSPTWTGQPTKRPLLYGRQADAIELPATHLVQVRAKARQPRPGMTRARVSAAMSGASLPKSKTANDQR